VGQNFTRSLMLVLKTKFSCAPRFDDFKKKGYNSSPGHQ
jgi:hypothetical protein